MTTPFIFLILDAISRISIPPLRHLFSASGRLKTNKTTCQAYVLIFGGNVFPKMKGINTNILLPHEKILIHFHICMRIHNKKLSSSGIYQEEDNISQKVCPSSIY